MAPRILSSLISSSLDSLHPYFITSSPRAKRPQYRSIFVAIPAKLLPPQFFRSANLSYHALKMALADADNGTTFGLSSNGRSRMRLVILCQFFAIFSSISTSLNFGYFTFSGKANNHLSTKPLCTFPLI